MSGQIRRQIEELEKVLLKFDEARDTLQQLEFERVHAVGLLAAAEDELHRLKAEVTAEEVTLNASKLAVTVQQGVIGEKNKVVSAKKAAIMDTLGAAAPDLDAAFMALRALDKTDLNEIKEFATPPPMVLDVVCAVCEMLGAKPEWESGRKILDDPHFVSHLLLFPKDSISDLVLSKLSRRLQHSGIDPDKVARSSIAARALCQWVVALHKYAHLARRVVPEQVEVEALDAALTRELEELVQRENVVKHSNTRLEDLRSEAAAKAGQTARLRASTNAQLEAAIAAGWDRLQRVAPEEAHWGALLRSLRRRLSSCMGDALMTTAAVAYYPCLPPNRWHTAVRVWRECLHANGICVSRSFSLAAMALSADERYACEGKSLPCDIVGMEAVGLMSACAKPPLVIDPLGHGLQWARELQFTTSYREVVAPTASPQSRQLFYASVDAASRTGMTLIVSGVSVDGVEGLDADIEAAIAISGGAKAQTSTRRRSVWMASAGRARSGSDVMSMSVDASTFTAGVPSSRQSVTSEAFSYSSGSGRFRLAKLVKPNKPFRILLVALPSHRIVPLSVHHVTTVVDTTPTRLGWTQLSLRSARYSFLTTLPLAQSEWTAAEAKVNAAEAARAQQHAARAHGHRQSPRSFLLPAFSPRSPRFSFSEEERYAASPEHQEPTSPMHRHVRRRGASGKHGRIHRSLWRLKIPTDDDKSGKIVDVSPSAAATATATLRWRQQKGLGSPKKLKIDTTLPAMPASVTPRETIGGTTPRSLLAVLAGGGAAGASGSNSAAANAAAIPDDGVLYTSQVDALYVESVFNSVATESRKAGRLGNDILRMISSSDDPFGARVLMKAPTRSGEAESHRLVVTAVDSALSEELIKNYRAARRRLRTSETSVVSVMAVEACVAAAEEWVTTVRSLPHDEQGVLSKCPLEAAPSELPDWVWPGVPGGSGAGGSGAGGSGAVAPSTPGGAVTSSPPSPTSKSAARRPSGERGIVLPQLRRLSDWTPLVTVAWTVVDFVTSDLRKDNWRHCVSLPLLHRVYGEWMADCSSQCSVSMKRVVRGIQDMMARQPHSPTAYGRSFPRSPLVAAATAGAAAAAAAAAAADEGSGAHSAAAIGAGAPGAAAGISGAYGAGEPSGHVGGGGVGGSHTNTAGPANATAAAAGAGHGVKPARRKSTGRRLFDLSAELESPDDDPVKVPYLSQPLHPLCQSLAAALVHTVLLAVHPEQRVAVALALAARLCRNTARDVVLTDDVIPLTIQAFRTWLDAGSAGPPVVRRRWKASLAALGSTFGKGDDWGSELLPTSHPSLVGTTDGAHGPTSAKGSSGSHRRAALVKAVDVGVLSKCLVMTTTHTPMIISTVGIADVYRALLTLRDITYPPSARAQLPRLHALSLASTPATTATPAALLPAHAVPRPKSQPPSTLQALLATATRMLVHATRTGDWVVLCDWHCSLHAVQWLKQLLRCLRHYGAQLDTNVWSTVSLRNLPSHLVGRRTAVSLGKWMSSTTPIPTQGVPGSVPPSPDGSASRVWWHAHDDDASTKMEPPPLGVGSVISGAASTAGSLGSNTQTWTGVAASRSSRSAEERGDANSQPSAGRGGRRPSAGQLRSVDGVGGDSDDASADADTSAGAGAGAGAGADVGAGGTGPKPDATTRVKRTATEPGSSVTHSSAYTNVGTEVVCSNDSNLLRGITVVNPRFRLFITTQPGHALPLSVLEQCVSGSATVPNPDDGNDSD